MFLTTLISLLCIAPGLLTLGCNVTCPVNSQTTRCVHGTDIFCWGSFSKLKASCDAEGVYCRCHSSALYDGCTCLPSISGCLIKRSPSTYIGIPSPDGSSETTLYGCVSTATNCEYEVHVIANYESSNGRHGFGVPRVAGNTYVNVNINGQSSKPLILVFTSYEPVNWRLNGVAVDRILVSGFYPSKVYGYSNAIVETVPRDILRNGYGDDDGGGDTADALVYLTKRFGPISSFSGSNQADTWNVNINRSPACNSSMSTRNNDPIKIRFENDKYQVTELAENITVALITNGPTDRNITVQYSTTDGTAQAPMDYTAINQTTIIPAGTTRFEITIPIKYDRVGESPENFYVHLSLPDEPTVCIPNTTVRIFNSQPKPTTNRPTTNRPTTNNRPTTRRPTFSFTPFTNRPAQASTGTLIGGVVGGIVVLTLVIAAVFYISLRIYARSQTAPARVISHDISGGTASNGIHLSTQPHPPPPPTSAFNLPGPEPQESVAVNITQPQTFGSITQAPPPAYDIHETFATYNESKKTSEAPPPYMQPPQYDIVATQETKY